MKITNTNESIAMRVSFVTILANLLLTVFKLFAGLFAKSGAMLSDAVHSASDVLSTLVVIAGVKIANKESDSDHQYGHERFESVAAIVLSIMLFVVGIGIGFSGLKKIFTANYDTLAIPGVIALIAAVTSILVKEGMFWYTKSAARKIDSGALMADAWHHRSDALSSIGSFIGVLGARLGFPILDPIASVIICFFIVKASYDIFVDSIDKITDKACDEKFVEEIKEIIEGQEGVCGVDMIKTRIFADKIYIDIEIQADGDSSLSEAHNIAQKIHDIIEEDFKKVKHCMVHVNPTQKVEVNVSNIDIN